MNDKTVRICSECGTPSPDGVSLMGVVFCPSCLAKLSITPNYVLINLDNQAE